MALGCCHCLRKARGIKLRPSPSPIHTFVGRKMESSAPWLRDRVPICHVLILKNTSWWFDRSFPVKQRHRRYSWAGSVKREPQQAIQGWVLHWAHRKWPRQSLKGKMCPWEHERRSNIRDICWLLVPVCQPSFRVPGTCIDAGSM